jgi:hypothetical protein
MDLAPLWEGADLIDAYPRAQALAEGVLIDVSGAARAAGFAFPAAMTARAHADLRCGDPARLRSALEALFAAARSAPRDADRVVVTLDDGEGQKVNAWALVGPGDDARPVLTVMLVGED